MKLTELDPSFRTYIVRDGHVYHGKPETLAEARGIQFLCPKCFKENNGPVGTHMCLCWSRSRGVPDEAKPGPGRWTMIGTGLHDLTLNADPPSGARSIQLLSGCAWHGYITNGEVHE